jgi:hypothetical protein
LRRKAGDGTSQDAKAAKDERKRQAMSRKTNTNT